LWREGREGRGGKERGKDNRGVFLEGGKGGKGSEEGRVCLRVSLPYSFFKHLSIVQNN